MRIVITVASGQYWHCVAAAPGLVRAAPHRGGSSRPTAGVPARLVATSARSTRALLEQALPGSLPGFGALPAADVAWVAYERTVTEWR